MRVVVIGGGIAGVSAGWELARRGLDVALVEAESTLAHHTTGRSAAQLIENYGAGPVRPLTHASLDFLRNPPADLVDQPLLTRRGVMLVAGPHQRTSAQSMLDAAEADGVEQYELTSSEAVDLFPWLRPELIDVAVWEPQSSDIDVGALHQAFVRGLRAEGAEIHRGARVTRLDPATGTWRVCGDGVDLVADLVVNAAGAWGDVVAEAADVEPVGLEPKRRTAFMVDHPDAGDHRFPLVADVDHAWYLKPDGAQVLCSPADETLSEPCDAKPEEVDIALAIDRINTATTLGIRSVASSWAGLRTFGPDGAMVIGPDPEASTFFWLVGQGGTGIQTAPGAARLLADLVVDGHSGAGFDALDLDALLPDRLR